MPERVASLCLFGSTPGLKNSQAPSWIPQIQAKGLRGFLAETIRDRLPADADPGPRRMVSRRGGEERPGLYRQVRALMASHDWSDAVARIACPALVVIPGAETVGTVANYEPFRVPDIEFRTYDGMPHNICDAVPDRCAADLRDFLRRRFG